MQERDAWGNQAVNVDARVEDEWDSIYVECQDCFESSSSNGVDLQAPYSSRGAAGAAATSIAFTGPPPSSEYSSASSAMAAFGMYGGGELELEEGEEEEGEGGQSEGEESEEEIIDCAIRGRWTFKNSDDPVSHEGVRVRVCVCVSSCYSFELLLMLVSGVSLPPICF